MPTKYLSFSYSNKTGILTSSFFIRSAIISSIMLPRYTLYSVFLNKSILSLDLTDKRLELLFDVAKLGPWAIVKGERYSLSDFLHY